MMAVFCFTDEETGASWSEMIFSSKGRTVRHWSSSGLTTGLEVFY
jgi:hypothetical protein